MSEWILHCVGSIIQQELDVSEEPNYTTEFCGRFFKKFAVLALLQLTARKCTLKLSIKTNILNIEELFPNAM